MFMYSCTADSIVCVATPFLLQIVKDMCMYKLNCINTNQRDTPNKQYLVINFVNKLVDQIKLKDILSNASSTGTFPVNDLRLSIPCISFNYSKTIRSDIVNYHQAIIDEETNPAVCHCSRYDNTYLDNHHKHVFTGNLSIIRNGPLNNLLKKGLNYREQQSPNKTKALQSIVSALDSYIQNTATALRKTVNYFRQWKEIILKEVKKRLESMRSYKYNKVLIKNSEEEKASKQLQKDFFLVPH